MSNKEPSKSSVEEDRVLTTAIGNAELFANTTDTKKLQSLYKNKKQTKNN